MKECLIDGLIEEENLLPVIVMIILIIISIIVYNRIKKGK